MPPTFQGIFEQNVPATMRDGVTLYANVFRPAKEGRYPIILTRTPYGKDNAALLSTTPFLNQVPDGYVLIIQDCRGTFASEGDFYPFVNEADDGYDTVEWAASLPYSDGNIGMYNGSYMGYTQWAAAIKQPPHLKCIQPVLCGFGQHNGWNYYYGAFALMGGRTWSTMLGALNILRLAEQGRDPEYKRILALSATYNVMNELKERPLKGSPFLEAAAPWYNDWLDHPSDDGRWANYEIERYQSQVEVPALHVAGWYDVFIWGAVQNYLGMKRNAASEEVRRGQHLIIGPWAHGVLSRQVGALDFGLHSSLESQDLLNRQKRWFDRYLKGEQNGLENEPPVYIFVMGDNMWRAEDEWPLARAVETSYFLHSNGQANSLDGNGSLSTTPPEAEPSDQYIFDPHDPVPTIGGRLIVPTFNTSYYAGPLDQSAVERRADVLVYTTEPLKERLEVTGHVFMKLYASSDCLDTDFTAKLVDVYPDGTPYNLGEAIIRARYRNSLAQPELLEPGQIYEYTLDLAAISIAFQPGHRIRLEIASSNFPRYDCNPNHGGVIASATDADIKIAHQTVLHNSQYPSRLILPIIPN